MRSRFPRQAIAPQEAGYGRSAALCLLATREAKGADDAFWTKHFRTPRRRLVYEQNFAPAWPYEGPFTQPLRIDWLPGLVQREDHRIELRYIPPLRQLGA